MKAGNRRLVSVIVILLAAGTVSAALVWEQVHPSVPLSGTMVRNCDPTSPTPTTVDLGTSGEMTFSCDSASPTTKPAFTTTARVVVKPTITGLAAPYNSSALYIYDADGATNTGICRGRTGAERIATGETENIAPGGWNYCAEYDNVDRPLPEFKVAWAT